jgi:trk system potassium uptake protein TrkH
VSTTGLVSISPGDSYNRFGEFVLMALIQLGGIGYMTIGSFAILATHHRFARFRDRVTHAVFTLPEEGIGARQLITQIVLFTLLIESLGAAALYVIFRNAGMAEPLWSAVFHSISAFCTAGFSLYNTSFENFHNNLWLNIVISLLSYLGALGFIVMADFWRESFRDGNPASLNSRLILHSTFWIAFLSGALLFVSDSGLTYLNPDERAMVAGFQAVTAMTTAGFSTYPTVLLTPASLLLIAMVMVVGVAPSGTGGGLKITTAATVYAAVRAGLRGEYPIALRGQRIAQSRLIMAFAVLGFYLLVLLSGSFILLLIEAHSFEDVLFEAASALATVGLCRDITGDLTPLGKIIITLLMFMGRVGPLACVLVLVPHRAASPQQREGDIEI